MLVAGEQDLVKIARLSSSSLISVCVCLLVHQHAISNPHPMASSTWNSTIMDCISSHHKPEEILPPETAFVMGQESNTVGTHIDSGRGSPRSGYLIILNKCPSPWCPPPLTVPGSGLSLSLPLEKQLESEGCQVRNLDWGSSGFKPTMALPMKPL